MQTISLILVLAACGPKEPAETAAAPEAAESSNVVMAASFPSDSASQAFAKTLLKTTFDDVEAVDTGGATLTYSSMRFKGDGTWKAEGAVEVADEKMECVESGTWTMDPAEKPSSAALEWTIDKTTCAGREPGETIRAQIYFQPDGTYKIKYR